MYYLNVLIFCLLPIFSKLWEARSRLYRNESLQVNSRWKALDEIYKIYKLLHRSAFKNSAKFRQTFSHFFSFILKSSLIVRIFFAIFVQISPILTNIFRNFSNFHGKDKNLLDSKISWDFAPKIIEISRKWLSKS